MQAPDKHIPVTPNLSGSNLKKQPKRVAQPKSNDVYVDIFDKQYKHAPTKEETTAVPVVSSPNMTYVAVGIFALFVIVLIFFIAWYLSNKDKHKSIPAHVMMRGPPPGGRVGYHIQPHGNAGNAGNVAPSTNTNNVRSQPAPKQPPKPSKSELMKYAGVNSGSQSNGEKTPTDSVDSVDAKEIPSNIVAAPQKPQKQVSFADTDQPTDATDTNSPDDKIIDQFHKDLEKNAQQK